MKAEPRTFAISGMHCAGCVSKVESAVGALPGVTQVVVSLEPGLARVRFDPARVEPAAIAEAIGELGYTVEERLEGQAALDREQSLRRAEIRRQGRWMVVAWPLSLVIMAGTFREYWILPALVPEWLGRPFVLFLLATPVVLGPGWQFFVQSARGLVRGVTDMNLLYATGIGAAYLIGVLNTFFPGAGFGGEKAIFFESAVLLTAFIILGKYLEALTRGRTSEAIRKLMRLQPKVARVVRDGEEREIPADEVEVSDVITVRPGEQIPVDGLIRLAFASLSQEDRVAVIDPAARKVIRTVTVGTVPIQVYATPDSKLLFVANQGTKKSPSTTVSVIDLETFEVAKTVETGPGAHGVVVSGDGRFAYVTNIYANSVSVIEVKDLKVIATIPVGRGPNGISVTP